MQKRFQINESIGDYRVTGFLGQGGMGEVYHGVHEKIGRSAAIKILGGAALADPTFKTRFFNEARLQAALHHPNIAALYDFREVDGQLFIFMEFVDGESLDDLVKRRSLAVEDALSIFLSVCEAVSYIHRNGVVHRDIKSQNIKLTSDGRTKLLDFGIAKDSSTHGLTQTGGVVGTPHYLAPEQLDGKPASPQTDIWALGVLFYEMLTGDMPFHGDSLAALILQITVAEFSSPDKLNPAVSADVSRIVRRCLEKNGSKRYQTVDDIVSDVQAALDRRRSRTDAPRQSGTFSFRSSEKKASVATAVVTPTDEEASSFVESPASRGNFPTLLIAAASAVVVLVLIVAIGGGIWLFGRPGKASASEDPKVNNGGTVSTTVKGDPQRLRIDVDEGTAQVLRDGKVLGTTPYDLEASRGENVNLTLRREGYEDKNVNLEITSGKKVFTFSLKSREGDR
jgi:serine/threonine-protein kinase